MKNELQMKKENTRMYLEFLVHALFAVLGAIVVASAASASPELASSSIAGAGAPNHVRSAALGR